VTERKGSRQVLHLQKIIVSQVRLWEIRVLVFAQSESLNTVLVDHVNRTSAPSARRSGNRPSAGSLLSVKKRSCVVTRSAKYVCPQIRTDTVMEGADGGSLPP
jgi:hypothetical protein